MRLLGHGPILGPEHCQICALWHRSARFRMLLFGVELDPLLRCKFRSRDPLNGRQREAAGLDHQREYFACSKGHGNPAGFVCQCRECNDSCPSRFLTVLED